MQKKRKRKRTGLKRGKKSLIRCGGSSLEVLLAAIQRFTPIYFAPKGNYAPIVEDPAFQRHVGFTNDPKVLAFNSLLDIWGVGPSSAAKLMLWGINSPADLRRDKEAFESINR